MAFEMYRVFLMKQKCTISLEKNIIHFVLTHDGCTISLYKLIKSNMKIYDSSWMSNKSQLHACLGPLLRLCRWFGYFPVEGLGQSNINFIKYNIRSVYSIYYLISFLGQLLMSGLAFSWFLESNTTLGGLSNFIFYITGVIGIILLFKGAKQWPKTLKKAIELEQSLEEIRVTKNTSIKTNITVYIVMLLALVEHLLSRVFNIKFVMLCTGQDYISSSVIERFFVSRHSLVFNYIAYNPLIAAITLILNFQATFLWSFADVSIMCFSMYLTSYFKDLNNAINSYKEKENIPWSKFRVHYANAVLLVKHIDSKLSWFLLLSFFNNLFFICFQLFNSLHRGYFEEKFCGHSDLESVASSPSYLIYYLFSLTFLIMRTIVLSVLVANVHSTAQGPLLALNEVPSSIYNMDVHRFQLQLRYTTIGLSGVFFYVTRKMILRVFGTIVTYELVLLQFSSNDSQRIFNVKENITSFHEL